ARTTIFDFLQSHPPSLLLGLQKPARLRIFHQLTLIHQPTRYPFFGASSDVFNQREFYDS
ncbi:hypothetical protein, partial [Termitidicoccus mucosus]|uniref:hypothetical protein n=1 Tax=Termitidicoccus mucosus TaxID=1184151 RepID=UPI002FEE5ACA